MASQLENAPGDDGDRGAERRDERDPAPQARAPFDSTDLHNTLTPRIARRDLQVRLVLAIVSIAVLLVVPISWTARLVLVGLTPVWVGLMTVIDRIGLSRPAFPAHQVNIALGMLMLWPLRLVFPGLQTLMLAGFVIGVAMFTVLRGMRWGLIVGACAGGLIYAAERIAPGPKAYDGTDYVIFPVLVVALAYIIDRMLLERRAHALNLAHRHAALREVVGASDLATALDLVETGARDTVGAATAAVLLRAGDHLEAGTELKTPDAASQAEIADYTRAELADPSGGPIATALREGTTVVVERPDADPRFPRWSIAWNHTMGDSELRSLAVVPLRVEQESVGVLIVLFDRRRSLDDDDVVLLEGFGDEAALAIVRHQAYEVQRAAAEQLAEADALKNEFLAMVTHELRTPLTAAAAFVDTVLAQWDRLEDEQRRELLARASGNARELSRLIGRLLDFARLDNDDMELALRPYPVTELVERVVDDISPVLGDHEVEHEIPTRLAVMADPEAFGHVLSNFLTNAAKYSPHGTAIVVRAEERAGRVTISVVDRGRGIAPADCEHVFDRFFQCGDAGHGRKGLGIGLAIVRRYAELQGATVGVTSELGVGSTFSVTLAAATSPSSEATATSAPDRTGEPATRH